jgi:arylformamidase
MDDETRAVAYSPSSALAGSIDPFISAYVENSKTAYAACPGVQTLSYGPDPSNTVDLVLPGNTTGPVPLHVFIHGGYWQELSKRESFFAAPDTLTRGMGYAAVDYTLAPGATVAEIAAECCAALSMLAGRAADLGIDPDRIVLSGSSAGAHLAAMCCLNLPAHQRPRGVVLLSGVYELEPLVGTYVNDALGLDAAAAQEVSPALKDLAGFPPALIAWGRQETEEFKRQSRWFAGLLKDAGVPAETLEMAHRNHFDIVGDLANGTALGRGLAELAGA